MRISEDDFKRLKNVRVAANSCHSVADLLPTNTIGAAKREKPSRSKFGNHRVESDGIKFDSKKELSRWNQLKMLEAAGHISELKRQVPFEIVPAVILDGKKQRPVNYIADFTYIEELGYITVEDSKGFKTPEYKIKRKLMKHVYGIEIKES